MAATQQLLESTTCARTTAENPPVTGSGIVPQTTAARSTASKRNKSNGWQGRNFFLTYPHCTIAADDYFNQLPVGLLPECGAVAQEFHQSGHPHLHVLLCYSRKLHFRDARTFDISGFHPNIQSARDIAGVYTYISKGSTPTLFGKLLSKLGTGYGALVASQSREEAFGAESCIGPRDRVIYYNQISAWIDRLGGDAAHAEQLPTTWIEEAWQANVREWFDRVRTMQRPRSLVLQGPSLKGKSTFARSLGRHTYFHQNWSVDLYKEDAQLVIADDCDFKFWPNKKAWFGGQKDFVVNDKYKKKTVLKGAKPFMWICNEIPVEITTELWYQSNVEIIQIL